MRAAPGLLFLMGCAAAAPQGEGADPTPTPPADPAAIYLGASVQKLDEDLVRLLLNVAPGTPREAVSDYGDCAVAAHALSRGDGFARHIRTSVAEEGGIWRADAVYTISSALPEGLKTIDAEVTLADCQAKGIPTV